MTVRLIYCAPGFKLEPWVRELAVLRPDASIDLWTPDGTHAAADYAIGWSPPDAFYASQPGLKALFNLGAGVDGLLRSKALPATLPVIRLEDAGMAPLMAEYVVQAAVRHARGLDALEADARDGRWTSRRPGERSEFPVGVLGAGALGSVVAKALVAQGFAVSVWSRSVKRIEGTRAFAGRDALDDFLRATRILVNLLPLTPETENLIDGALLSTLIAPAYLINVARGRHVVDDDLLAAIADGRVAGATLDVFREEPLPAAHPFWREPRIAITPHCSAVTQRAQTLAQIVDKIARLERGETVGGVVDRARGY